MIAATKQYKTLARNYLAKPDPATWLVLADLCEDSGELALAAQWHRRAAWFDLLMTARLNSSLDYSHYREQVRFGEWHFEFCNKDGAKYNPYVEICVTLEDHGRFRRRRFHVQHKAFEKTYWTQRMLGIIDWCSEVEAKQP